MSARDLFELDEVQTTEQAHATSEPHIRAMASIERVLRAGLRPVMAFSGGKDSSAMVNLTFAAAINVLKSGAVCPPISLINADTGVESCVVRHLADSEIAKMKRFAAANCIDFKAYVTRPTLSASFAVRVLGGRALPPFPQSNSDCTTSWKILPSERIQKRLAQEARAQGTDIVLFIGTRSAESARRATNTAARKETAHQVWLGPEGQKRLSPILDFSTDEVWTYLAEAAAGEHESYSDHAAMMEFYSDAGASSCVIVADMRSAANSKPCGSRSGCWVCLRVKNDHSAVNMIAQNPERYPYLVPLLELRNFMVDTQWDFSRRAYLGRTIDDEGMIKVRADQYSPEMCKQLLRYTLAAQSRANELGAPSPVRAIGLRELIAIDFVWSLRAMHKPFTALKIYLEHEEGKREYAPKVVAPVRQGPVPLIGEIHVGSGWDEDEHPLRPEGLRDPLWEMFAESCGPSLRRGANGKVFLDLEEEPEFDVDLEGAALFLEFEAERMVREHHETSMDWTTGASIYLRYGTVSLAKGQSSGIDSMMRRSQWLQRHDLHGQRSPDELRERCATLCASQPELFA